jgi:ribosome-associated protein
MSPKPSPILDIPDRLREVVSAAQDRKAVDLRVLGVDEVSDFTEYFLICSGSSERQVQAIADAVQEKLRDDGVKPLGVEGFRHGSWVLIDYGEFVVHIFNEQVRARYGLEKLWADSSDVTDSFVQ